MHTGTPRKMPAKLAGARRLLLKYYRNTTMEEWIFPWKYRMLKMSLLKRFPNLSLGEGKRRMRVWVGAASVNPERMQISKKKPCGKGG